MIRLRDKIAIRTTPGQLFEWLARLPEVYTAWHPDHVSCRLLEGTLYEVGSRAECEEYLHGKLHSMRFRVTKSVPNRRIEYTVEGMGRGAFEAEVEENSVGFIAELDFGLDTPIIGQALDLIFYSVFRRRIEALRQHMAEEGQNLKAILESGGYTSADQDAA